MRAPFNTTCDLFQGPGGKLPGSMIGTFDCRYVVEDAITTVGAGSPEIPVYITLEDAVPRGMWTAPFFGIDPDLADRVAIPSGETPAWCVLYTDVIDWDGQTTYYRSYLLALPPPPIRADGGLLVGGAAAYHVTRIWYPGGGLVAGGSATVKRVRTWHGSGGVLGSGTAVPTFTPGHAWRIVDHFDVADQVNTGRTPDTTDVPATTWAAAIGVCSVVSAQLVGTTFSGAVAFAVIDNAISMTSMSVSLTLPSLATRQIAVVSFRYSNTSNFWYAQVEYTIADPTSGNNKIFLVSVIAGTTTVLGSVSATIPPSTPITLTLTDDGTNISATAGGGTINGTSTSLASNTSVGLAAVSLSSGVGGSPTFDDFFAN